jgi:hypothetical protein
MSDYCKTAEFPMKAYCDECESFIETVHNFYDFYKALLLKSLWNRIFFEFRDNGLYGCRLVVVVCDRKWARFGGAWGAAQ